MYLQIDASCGHDNQSLATAAVDDVTHCPMNQAGPVEAHMK